MFIKLEKRHSEDIKQYLSKHKEEVIYFEKPFEQLNEGVSLGVFYGYDIGHGLEGLFYFSSTSALMVHYTNSKVLGNLSLLKAIKYHTPKFIKGLKEHVAGIERILYRAVQGMKGVDVVLMVFEAFLPQMRTSISEGWVESYDENWLKDMRFFIEVENHFGRQVLSVGDMAKAIKHSLERGNFILKVHKGDVVGQGLIEEECREFAIIGGIYVVNAHRKRGIGYEITVRLTQKVLERGKKVFLFVKNNNTNARNIYENIGYHTLKTFTILSVNY